MSIVNILILLLFISGYVLLVFDQNRFTSLTISSLVQSKVDYYELEGWLYYGIAFYKANIKQLKLPYLKKISLKQINNGNCHFDININIANSSVSINEQVGLYKEPELIDITVTKYLGSKLQQKLTAQLIICKGKFKIKKIY